MQITLISPPFGEGGQKSKGLDIAPPVLEYLAGLTEHVRPGAHEVTLVDANKRDFDPDACEADLVGMTVLTPQAPWAYRIADRLRARGIQVLFGGIHVHALPDEAAPARRRARARRGRDDLGRDSRRRRGRALKPRYDGPFAPLEGPAAPAHGAAARPLPVRQLLHLARLPAFVRVLLGARLLRQQCAHAPHRRGGRRGRGEQEAAVLEHRRQRVGREREPLHRAVQARWRKQVHGKWWFGSGDLVTIGHSRADELLDWARRAGMTSALVGFESPSPLVLEELKATNKQGRDRIDAIKRIRAAGIDVMLFIMTGSRADHAARLRCDRGVLRDATTWRRIPR